MKGIRRREKEITDRQEMIRILMTAKYVTVAMSAEDGPYLATLTHAYDQARNALYFHCAREGRKVDVLKKDSRVWGQALLDKGYVEGKCDHLYATAQFKGRVTFIEDAEEKRHALEIMIRKNEPDPERVLTEQVTKSSLVRVNIGRIDIEYMSGKKSEKVIVSM